MAPVAFGLLCVAWTAAARADNVSVAVAANFSAPMQRIAAEFEKDTGHKAELSVGATGKFYAQIRNGAPFEILLGDDETPQRLAAEGAAVPASRFTYAIGRLCCGRRGRASWTRRAKLLIRAASSTSRSPTEDRALRRGSGRGLGRLRLLDGLQPSSCRARTSPRRTSSSPAATPSWASSPCHRSGTTALTGGSAWIVPATLHAPLRQEAVLLLPGGGKPAAQALLAHLRGDKARRDPQLRLRASATP